MTALKDTTIVITGGNGFLGAHLATRLLTEKSKIHILDLFKHYNKLNPYIEPIKAHIKLHNVDLRNFTKVSEKIKEIQPEIIYHLAAITTVRDKIKDINKAIAINICGTTNLFRAIEKVRLKRYIYIGTSEEYGDSQVPFKEFQPLSPTSLYSASKASSEMFCIAVRKMYDIPITILRLFNLYGPAQKPTMLIPALIISCLEKKDFKATEGAQYREWNYVEDSVSAIVKATVTKKAIGEIINIGCGKEYSIKEVILKIINKFGYTIKPLFGALPYRKAEIWHMYCDNTKAKKLLNWVPKYSLDEGLDKTIAWYKDNYWSNIDYFSS